MGILRKSDRSIIYLQNSGFFNGENVNAITLLCKGNFNEIENIVNHAANFIERNHVSYPIKWRKFIDKDPSITLNSEGNFIADNIREKCMLIGEFSFQGGSIYGGKSGDKFVQTPSLKLDFLPVKSERKSPIVMSVCTFKDRHKCDIQLRKGNVGEIKNYQKEIAKMIVKRELAKWEKTSHRKKPLIIEPLKEIKEDLYHE